ncbi:dynamin family protein [Aliiruegeria sabulilitoris]|uniref:dynamin family protein n=1 Tax=Aliiruegeria sabulilitoris TaxID=1510458 RepID=UPI00082E5612|nr:dynamin family protein [Aliiruegeria sabulilitoris]
MFHNPQLKVESPPLPNSRAAIPDCAEERVARRPRIAVMGEFSAGKSTLTNLLIGSNALPVKVTATQLPPVWLNHGTGAPYGVDKNGDRFDVDLARIGDIPLENTQYLHVERHSNVLELCDIIDFPGISDPNMPADLWQRVIAEVDAVLWCSHAVQAWRQSEAAAWEEMPVHLQERSLLLLTRMDKLVEERDRQRVLSRVRRETDGLFADIFPISLTRALAAGEDRDAWEASGAERLMTALLELIMSFSPAGERPAVCVNASIAKGTSSLEVSPSATAEAVSLPSRETETPRQSELQPEADQAPRIVPRRVSLKGPSRRGAQTRPRS